MSVIKILRKLFLLCFALTGLGGCVANHAGCGPFDVPGEISAAKEQRGSEYCKVEVTYTNTHSSTVHPYVKAIFFDPSGNTIDSSSYSFDSILAGRSQKKTGLIRCNGQEIKSMQVENAYHQNLCWKNRCKVICGVDGRTLTWK